MFMRPLNAVFLIALLAMSTTASAQNDAPTSSPASCPSPSQITPLHLYGLWRAEFEGQAQGATVLFERHPELSGSVSGGVNRNGAKALVAGDVDNGEFTLEESSDGQRITATWLGKVVENSCGKEIRGTWHKDSTQTSYPFVLRKVPGWQ